MEEMIEQEKHEIALMTEHTLYSKIRAYNENDNIDEKTKEELKNVTIEAFIEYCIKRYKTLTPEQVREHVLYVLNRTINNIKKLKLNDEER